MGHHTAAAPERLPRYLATLVGLYGLILLALVQVKELRTDPGWTRMAVVPGWIALLTLYFLWIKRMLTYKLVARRDMLRASLLSGAVIVFIVVFSSWVMEYWIDLYAGDYGVFGVVIAIFFWIGFSSAVIVLAPLTGARRAAPSATPPRTAGPQPT